MLGTRNRAVAPNRLYRFRRKERSVAKPITDAESLGAHNRRGEDFPAALERLTFFRTNRKEPEKS